MGTRSTENHKNPQHGHCHFPVLLGKSLLSLCLKSSISKMLAYILPVYLGVEGANVGKERRKETNIHCAYMHFLF